MRLKTVGQVRLLAALCALVGIVNVVAVFVADARDRPVWMVWFASVSVVTFIFAGSYVLLARRLHGRDGQA